MDCKLNYTEICRCCTRTESCMSSIFDENAHSTYPAVKVMLNTIASLNVLEFDELPWLVCKLCLNSIQHAYTFIQHLKHIDNQLQQIPIPRGKQEDTLPQRATLKIEPEVVPVPEIEEYKFQPDQPQQLEEEQEQTGPLLTATKDDENSSNLNQNLDRNEEIEVIEDVDNEAELVYQAQGDIEGCINVDSSEGEDELLKVTKIEHMVDFDGVHENYQVDVEEGNNTYSLESESNHVAIDDEVEEIWPKSQSKVEHTPTLKFTLFKCKLCVYTCKCMSLINRHLQSHSKEKQFECSKCNVFFTHKHNMLQHWRNCNGESSQQCQQRNQLKRRNNRIKLVSCPDLKDPLKMKKYYTVTEIDVQNQNKEGENMKLERPKGRGDDADTASTKFTLLKCKFCTYTCMIMGNLKKHLHIHCKDKPFKCSKCTRAFTQKAHMVQHGRICNGEIRYVHERKEPKLVIYLKDLKDPVKIKQYYTEIDM